MNLAQSFAIWGSKIFLMPGTGIARKSEVRSQKSEDTKPTAKPVTLDYVRWAAANVTVPWFAIGGINLENLGDVLAAGAKRVCVVSAILNAPDVAAACAAFRQRLTAV